MGISSSCICNVFCRRHDVLFPSTRLVYFYLQQRIHLDTACCYLDPRDVGLPPPKHHEVCCTICASIIFHKLCIDY